MKQFRVVNLTDQFKKPEALRQNMRRPARLSVAPRSGAVDNRSANRGCRAPGSCSIENRQAVNGN
jgi:hypothetical protein